MKYALQRYRDMKFWSIGRVCALIVGNHELLRKQKKQFLLLLDLIALIEATSANANTPNSIWEILTDPKNSTEPFLHKLIEFGITDQAESWKKESLVGLAWDILTDPKSTAKDREVFSQKLQDLGLSDASTLASCEKEKLVDLASYIKSCRWGDDIDPHSTLTYAQRCSFIDVLQRAHPDSSCKHPILDLSYDEAVGEAANRFISFAYDDNFIELVESVELYFQTHPDCSEEKTYFWLDLFVNNQWGALDISFDKWTEIFRTAVQRIGHILCFFSTYKNPTLMTRAWSLFEIYSSVVTNCEFDVIMSAENKRLFLEDIVGATTDHINEMLTNIDCEKSKCFVEEDMVRIKTQVKREVGFNKINSMVFEQLREWVIETTKEAIAGCSDNSNDDENEEGANINIYKIDLKAALASLYQGQGRYELAEPLYIECLEGRKTKLGLDHPSTLTSINNLALLYYSQGRYELAEPLYIECLEAKKTKLGLNHPDTLKSINFLKAFQEKKGKNK